MKINDDVAKILGFSPRHTEALRAALQGIDHRDVNKAALVLGNQCRLLRIADFPNPFRGRDEEATATWDRVFLAAYHGEAMAPPEPFAEEDQWPPDFDAMTKAEIQVLIEDTYGVRVSMHTDKPTMVAKALRVIEDAPVEEEVPEEPPAPVEEETAASEEAVTEEVATEEPVVPHA